jgi:metal-responsive CopG/Arc/MetJ family transcriptional regulator
MKKTKGSKKSMKMQDTPAVRASISFPPALYETLEDIAKQKKVSLAWVVRDAAERYVAGEAKEGRG